MTLADLTDEELLGDIRSMKTALRTYQREVERREHRYRDHSQHGVCWCGALHCICIRCLTTHGQDLESG